MGRNWVAPVNKVAIGRLDYTCDAQAILQIISTNWYTLTKQSHIPLKQSACSYIVVCQLIELSLSYATSSSQYRNVRVANCRRCNNISIYQLLWYTKPVIQYGHNLNFINISNIDISCDILRYELLTTYNISKLSGV